MHPPTLRDMTRFAAYAAYAEMGASIRRTLLGPLWSTLGLTLLLACLGLFFGTVLKQQLPDLETYIPFLVAGMIAWTFMANCIHQSCSQIWGFLNILRHNRLTLAVPVLRVVIQNTIILLLNILVAMAFAFVYFGELHLNIGALAAGLILLVLNAGWMSYLAALICARFRDLPQLIAWGIHLTFFLTPILWVEQNLGRFEYLLYFNPFAWLVAAVRQPLLGLSVELYIWLAVGLLTVLGSFVAMSLGRRTARLLPYWL
jgi:ABC-type polysaccharide/polyol phosphate export permease